MLVAKIGILGDPAVGERDALGSTPTRPSSVSPTLDEI
jgi:hypothetical protein